MFWGLFFLSVILTLLPLRLLMQLVSNSCRQSLCVKKINALLTSFPDIPTAFRVSGTFYHVHDMNVYPGRQRGRYSDWENTFCEIVQCLEFDINLIIILRVGTINWLIVIDFSEFSIIKLQCSKSINRGMRMCRRLQATRFSVLSIVLFRVASDWMGDKDLRLEVPKDAKSPY